MTLKLIQDFNVLIENFWKDCKLRGMTKESSRRYKSSLEIFADYFRNTNPVDVNNQMLKDFLEYLKFERGVKHKTIENYFAALSAFYDYLIFEEITDKNMILPFRKRYLKMYKNDSEQAKRQLLSIEDTSRLVNFIMDPRDKAISVLLAKTGIRRGEMLKLDVDDIDWNNYSIVLKPTPKRSNRTVFFDDECSIVLRRWLRVREKLNPTTKALFISYQTFERLSRNGASNAVVKYAQKLGFHNSGSNNLKDHFGPHCFRHWFTTNLRRGNMKKDFIKELRGDARGEAMDIYDHIEKQELKKAYLAAIPRLGVF